MIAFVSMINVFFFKRPPTTACGKIYYVLDSVISGFAFLISGNTF